MVSRKVLDVTYLFHLRLDFFVKKQKMRETEWHLERLKALINADMTETVRLKKTQNIVHTLKSDICIWLVSFESFDTGVSFITEF